MPRASHRLALMTGAGVTALALALTGCSSSQPSDPASPAAQETVSASPASFMVRAADATRAAGSARIALNSTIETSAQQLGAITVKGTGIVDFANQAMEMSMDMNAMGMNQTLKMLVADGNSYVQMSMLGDKWIQAPASEVGVNVQDPSQALEQLKEVADLKEAGTEDVNGAPATKYTGTVDILKALAAAGITQEQLGDADLSKIGKTAAIAVWVDESDRIVRMDQSLKMTVPEAGEMTMKTSTTFSDFGVEADITPPPASEVTQMPTGMPTPSATS